jgi:hypothetical protein
MVLAGAAVLLAGCGGGDDYKNELRPPSPINVTAYVSAQKVSVSPASFGAGPIVVIVTNQSNSSQDVTFSSQPETASFTQSTGPINPGDTGQIKIDVAQGSYLIKTGDQSIRPATLTVGAERQSAQNELLQP